jgi:hypothetical protein
MANEPAVKKLSSSITETLAMSRTITMDMVNR